MGDSPKSEYIPFSNHITSQINASSGSANALPVSQQPRIRAACSSCRSTKQRCLPPDAGTGPCKRCQLYSLDCLYGDKPPVKKTTSAKRSSAKKTTQPSPDGTEDSTAMLQIILSKLENLEVNLINHQTTNSSRDGLLPPQSSQQRHTPVSPAQSVYTPLPSMQNSTMLPSPYAHSPINDAFGAQNMCAIDRGIVSVNEASDMFAFFHSRCAPFAPFISPDTHDAMQVRGRSPILFHAILATAAFYTKTRDFPNSLNTYYRLVTLLTENLGPLIVLYSPEECTNDLFAALCIMVMWKAIRVGSHLSLLDDASFKAAQVEAKLTSASMSLLSGLAAVVARKLHLSGQAYQLVDVDHNSIDSNNSEHARCLEAARLWLALTSIEGHQALQEGRLPAIDVSASLPVARIFGSTMAMNYATPSDIRVAAITEIHAAARSTFARPLNNSEFMSLYRANEHLDRALAHWLPIVNELPSADIFAYYFNITVLFARLVINVQAYQCFSKRLTLPEAYNMNFSFEELHCLAIAIASAEEICFSLSLDSRMQDRNGVFGSRQVRWPTMPYREGFHLTVDGQLADYLKTSFDTFLCTILPFPLLFLARVRSDNVIDCELSLMVNAKGKFRFEPDPPIRERTKFVLLLRLTSSFLRSAAPNPQHPIIAQADFLQQLSATAACVPVQAAHVQYNERMREYTDGTLPGSPTQTPHSAVMSCDSISRVQPMHIQPQPQFSGYAAFGTERVQLGESLAQVAHDSAAQFHSMVDGHGIGDTDVPLISSFVADVDFQSLLGIQQQSDHGAPSMHY